MLDKLRRVRGRTLAELRFRGVQAVYSRLERARLAVGVPPQYDSNRDNTSGLIEAIRHVLSGLGGQAQTAREVIAHLSEHDQPTLNRLREQTRQLHAGRVQLLGYEYLTVGANPNWHCDIASGRVAPRKHWSRIPYLDSTLVGDHKSLWELNRHQYLYAPALTWLADGNEADFLLVQRHIASWLDENPPTLGVNWCSSLEVAYRAITWCWLLWLLGDAPWSKSLLSRMSDMLERSGLHVERYLSTYFSPNTHLTGEALCLYYLGSVLPHCRHARRWQAMGAAILEGQLAGQVLPDGVYTEQATLYQRYTAEIYLHYFCLARAIGKPASAAVTRALHGAFEVLRSVASADARLPLIGDDDGGQLLPIDQRSPEMIAGVLLSGACVLGRPDLMAATPACPAMAYALCGVKPVDALLQRADQHSTPAWTDRFFPDGGIAALRDNWSTGAAVAVIDAGPHGLRNCGHSHADALAMTLAIGSAPLFIDRGTLTYIGSERDEFRSSASHNTVEFDGVSSVAPRGPFQWGRIPERPTGALRQYGDTLIFFGRSLGHAESARPSTHRRVVVRDGGGAWVIFDHAERAGMKRAVVRWQLAPGLVAKAQGNVLVIEDEAEQQVAQVAVLGARSIVQSVRYVSLRYGHRAPATVIAAEVALAGFVATVVVPAGRRSPLGRLTVNGAPGDELCHWGDATHGHQIWTPGKGTDAVVEPNGLAIEAQALWRRTLNGNLAGDSPKTDRIIAIAACRVALNGNEALVTAEPNNGVSDVVVCSSELGWTILPGTTL